MTISLSKHSFSLVASGTLAIAKYYVIIAVGGIEVSRHLAALQQTVGANRRVKRSFTSLYARQRGEYSSQQVLLRAKDIATTLEQTPPATQNTFIYNDVALPASVGNIQGICYAHNVSLYFMSTKQMLVYCI